MQLGFARIGQGVNQRQFASYRKGRSGNRLGIARADAQSIFCKRSPLSSTWYTDRKKPHSK